MVNNTPANMGDVGLIPGSATSPGEGKWQPTPVLFLGNPMNREEPGGPPFGRVTEGSETT